MNLIIPCAGQAKRFKEAGYKDIKPFILTKDKLMLEWALSNLINCSYKQKFIFLFQKEHIDNYNVKGNLGNICNKLGIKNYELIPIDKLTDGCARTVLYARDLINNDEELILANSDQFVDNFNIAELIGYSRALNLSSGILTHNATDSKWSFCKRKGNTIYIDLVKEKEPISSMANTGHFYWRRGKDFIWSIEEMIKKDIRIGGEVYISPSINELITIGELVSNYHLDEKLQKFFGLGVPYDLLYFIYNYKT